MLRSKVLQKFLSSDWTIGIFLLLLAAAIRTIPEIKAGVWPIGYDTFNSYAAEIATYHGSLVNWLLTANLLYFLFLPFKLAGLAPDLIMKIFGPIMYGGLIISFFIFARRFLKFSGLKAFLLTILAIFQLAALRISWDLYRNELGLIFLFWGLIYLPGIGKTKNLVLFTIFAFLVSLSNELVTVLLIVILLANIIYQLIKRRWEELVSTLIPLMVVATSFLVVISSSGQTLYNSHVIFVSEKSYFWRYFYRYHLEISYNLLKEIITSLFWLLYGYLLVFALIGFWFLRRNLVLIAITFWLLLGTFSSLLFRGSGIMVWERWLFMLVFPLAIYTTEGIYQIGALLGKIKKWTIKMPKLAFSGALIFWVVFLGLFVWRAIPFLTADYSEAKPPLANDELNSYFPRTMIHNSIGLGEMKTTLKVVKWLDRNAPAGSIILVDNRYRGMMITNFNIDDRYIITNSWSENPQKAAMDLARSMNQQPVYLIWNISKSIDGFDRVYSAGNKGVYEALPEFYSQ